MAEKLLLGKWPVDYWVMLVVKNFNEIALSYTVSEIITLFNSAKIKDSHHKLRKLKFFPFQWDTLILPCGPKIHSKSLYLLWFPSYLHIFIFR